MTKILLSVATLGLILFSPISTFAKVSENSSSVQTVAETKTETVKTEIPAPIGKQLTTEKAEVTTKVGLRLRDKDCKFQIKIPYGTVVKVKTKTEDTRVCKIQGKRYLMQAVVYKDKDYFGATAYLREIK